MGGLAVALVLLASGSPLPPREGIVWGLGAGVFGGIGLLLFYRGLAAGVMTIVAPIAACGTIIPVAVSYALGQVPSGVASAGIVAALIGIVLVSLPSSGSTSHPSGEPRLVVTLALGSAVAFGCFLVALERGAAASGAQALWVIGAARVGSLAALLSAAVVGRETVRWPGRRIVPLAVIGALDTTANALFALASLSGALGVVSVLGSLYPVATVVLARVVLAERLARPQAAGVALALAGVALMSAGQAG